MDSFSFFLSLDEFHGYCLKIKFSRNQSSNILITKNYRYNILSFLTKSTKYVFLVGLFESYLDRFPTLLFLFGSVSFLSVYKLEIESLLSYLYMQGVPKYHVQIMVGIF